MRKENCLKKILVYSLLGFPIGITLLMVNYAGVYLIAGENIFKAEIMQLQDIKTLVLQLLVIGVAYYLFFILINIIVEINGTKYASNKFIVEHPYKSILIMVVPMIVLLFIGALLNLKIFTKNISDMNLNSFIIIWAIFSLGLCIKSGIESEFVKKINQRLKERNK